MGLLDADGFGDFAVAVAERLAQDEHRAFGRREPLHQGEQRERHGLALLGALQRAERAGRGMGEHRLGEPRPGVQLAAGTGGGELVDAEVRHDLGQPGGGRTDDGAVGRAPPQIRVLDDVLGLARRTEHPVREREQPGPVRFELRDSFRGHARSLPGACAARGDGDQHSDVGCARA